MQTWRMQGLCISTLRAILTAPRAEQGAVMSTPACRCGWTATSSGRAALAALGVCHALTANGAAWPDTPSTLHSGVVLCV